jgi:hypothetical protein
MSLEARYQHHSANTVATISNLDRLEQIAAAAGHGYSQIGLDLNAGWTEIAIAPENVRPSYDLNYIKTFSPEVLAALLFELNESRNKLAELGATITVPTR